MTNNTHARTEAAPEPEEVEVMPGVFLTARRPRATEPAPAPAPKSASDTLAAEWSAYITALHDLSTESVIGEYRAVDLAATQLVRSNAELAEYAAADPDPVLTEAIRENEAVLVRFEAKKKLVLQLLHKRGVDTRHAVGAELVEPAEEGKEEEEEEEGVFL
ncbi:hypothetical protein H9P43_003527 [Blastocladiella emersonii ATCC 22665]|nr:hypothetical protein H9P43_003527 [Blastocladiella emersonii ATCC 22665]